MYKVIWTGGERDGEVLKTFEWSYQAINFAVHFQTDHEGEFDPVCGGVRVEDENGKIVW